MNTLNGRTLQGTRTLWTRQVREVLKTLEDEGVYRVKEEYIRCKNDTIADYYLSLYRWYTETARTYIDLSENDIYPVWFSVSDEYMLQPVEGTVILKAEVPCDRIVWCNAYAWDLRANNWYVPLDGEDSKRHDNELKRYGIASDDELIGTDKGNFYPLLRKEIIDSWERVFTMPAEDKDLIATTWELQKDWVKQVL